MPCLTESEDSLSDSAIPYWQIFMILTATGNSLAIAAEFEKKILAYAAIMDLLNFL